jgi:hypothetical protein
MATSTTGATAPDPENELIQARRAIAGVPSGDPRQGLALSGGGIRSATFCFGLLRGLARKKVLTGFDYLSTVSGGGYIGSALGRLYQSDYRARQVQERLDQDDTLLLWWLRSNGRYLTPAGVRDLGQAAASIVRNVLFSQFEVAALMLLLAACMLLPYALLASGGEWPQDFHGTAGSAWWCALVLPLFGAGHCIFSYWYCREWPTLATRLANVGGALLAGCAGAVLAGAVWDAAQGPGGMAPVLVVKAVLALLLLSPVGAAVLSFAPAASSAQAALRLRHTKRLGQMLWWLLGLALLGLLDFAAWWLAGRVAQYTQAPAIGAAGLATLVAAVRKALPRIQHWKTTLATKAIKTEVLLNIGGLLLVLLLALVWMTVLHALVRPELGWTLSPLANWGVVLVLSLAYVVLTGKDVEVLNLSSLHHFYRARIERAYVSVGNYPRGEQKPEGTRFPDGSPLGPARRAGTERVAKLVEAVDGDDIALADYAPHAQGGPIHLITCCINQSVDDRTGNYNADRLGIALTVSALGAETGTARPTPLNRLPEQGQCMGKLSRWIAVSGAAAASGMGSQTTPGLAALLFLSGLRLGFWTPRLLAAPPPPSVATPQTPPLTRSVVVARWLAARFPKPRFLLAEFLARFPGLRSPAWYLSDGGHFENTGVYALLKRQLDVIVLADCGADPHYRFGDLENMARKAEIDYGASIEFIDPATLVAQSAEETALFAHVGSVKTITAQAGPQCLLLARIRYDGRDQPGLLIVVKPRLLDAMPLEIAGYAARNATFPQQTTSDQFFDEAQWEAYHQLGLRLGGLLSAQAMEIFRNRVCLAAGA